MIAGLFKLLMFYLLYVAVKNLINGFMAYKQVKAAHSQATSSQTFQSDKNRDFSGQNSQQKQDIEADYRVLK